MSELECSRAEQLIVRHLDEGLDEKTRELLESHIRVCPSCRRVKEEMGKLLDAIASDVPDDPGDEFWKHYRISLDAALREKQMARRWSPAWKVAAAVLAATAAFLVVRLAPFHSPESAVLDNRAAETLLKDLYQVYGPRGEQDLLPLASRNGVMEYLARDLPQYDESSMRWFEVEDEPNPLFL